MSDPKPGQTWTSKGTPKRTLRVVSVTRGFVAEVVECETEQGNPLTLTVRELREGWVCDEP